MPVDRTVGSRWKAMRNAVVAQPLQAAGQAAPRGFSARKRNTRVCGACLVPARRRRQRTCAAAAPTPLTGAASTRRDVRTRMQRRPA